MRLDVFPGKPLSYLIDQAGEPGKKVSPDILVMVGGTNNVSEESIIALGEKFTN